MTLPRFTEEETFIKHTLPSNKNIGVYGWHVKEEKDLLFATEIDTTEENKIGHIINLLKQCVDDKSKFDTLSENDLIKIAIEARKLAKGETIEYNYKCPHDGCGHTFFDEVNISKEQYVKPFDNSPLVVNNKLTFTFRDLDWKTSEKLYKESDTAKQYEYKHIIHSIDSVTIDGTTYTEFTTADMEERIGELKTKDLKTLSKGYAERLSDCGLKRSVKCLKCGKDIEIEFGDLLSFLVL